MTVELKFPVKPSRTEKLISLFVLTILALIAAGIFAVQPDYNPAVVQLFSEPARTGEPRRAETAIIPLPEGVAALTAPETFTPLTLSDKINGKAELYLTAGFKQLKSQRFGDPSAPDRWFEIFVYDMAAPDNAFAVYSSQMREDGITADLGPYAYRTANALFWVHGPYYLELIAAEDSESSRRLMQEIAESFNQATASGTRTVMETDLFPTRGLDSKSIVLIPGNAFGMEKFDRVLVAEYAIEGLSLTAFISNRGTAEAAARMAEEYRQFLVAFGGQAAAVGNGHIIDILDAYEIIFTQGPYVAGIHEASDREKALELARSLQSGIEDAIGRQ